MGKVIAFNTQRGISRENARTALSAAKTSCDSMITKSIIRLARYEARVIEDILLSRFEVSKETFFHGRLSQEQPRA